MPTKPYTISSERNPIGRERASLPESKRLGAGRPAAEPVGAGRVEGSGFPAARISIPHHSRLRFTPGRAIALCLGLSLGLATPSFAVPKPAEVIEVSAKPLSAPSAEFVEQRGSDVIYFGFVGPDGFAIEGETWTWDHGAEDPFEGWTDTSAPSEPPHFQQLDAAAWSAGGNAGTAPILSGEGSAWLGLHRDEADLRCWVSGTGYGNNWDQSLRSPTFVSTGTQDVTISFDYFSDLEEDFDRTCLQVRFAGGGPVVPGVCYTGREGYGNPPGGRSTSVVVDKDLLGGNAQFELVFTMTSDAGWSDEDGQYPTNYGALGLDDLVVSGGVVGGSQTFQFEEDLEGWVPESNGGVEESGLAVADLSTYDIPDGDLDGCDIWANVLAFHDENEQHASDSYTVAVSPPANLAALDEVYEVAGEFEYYKLSTSANPMLHRVGWEYYPVACPNTGAATWSDRVGSLTYFNVEPGCHAVDSDGAPFVPIEAEQVRLVYEVVSGCEIFGIPEPSCTDNSDFSPIIDNVRIRATQILDPADVPVPESDSAATFAFTAVFPNPSETATQLSFALPRSGPVSLTIHGPTGRVIRRLVQGDRPAGGHTVSWDGRDDLGRVAPTGVYWSRLEYSGDVAEARIVRVR